MKNLFVKYRDDIIVYAIGVIGIIAIGFMMISAIPTLKIDAETIVPECNIEDFEPYDVWVETMLEVSEAMTVETN